jgi:hypothetical protein
VCCAYSYTHDDVARREGKRRTIAAATLNRVCSFSRSGDCSGHHDRRALLLSSYYLVSLSLSPIVIRYHCLRPIAEARRSRGVSGPQVVVASCASVVRADTHSTATTAPTCVRAYNTYAVVGHSFYCGYCGIRASFALCPRMSFPFAIFRTSIFPSSVRVSVAVRRPSFVLVFRSA